MSKEIDTLTSEQVEIEAETDFVETTDLTVVSIKNILTIRI